MKGLSIRDYFTKGDERSLKYKKNALLLLLLKGASLFISLLYVPLLLNSLDTERYGIWLTLTSIVSWIAMMDIGLGNGLRNRLAEAIARGDYQKGREFVSSTYIALGVYITLFVIALCVISYFLLNWNVILNAPRTDKEELQCLVLIVFICYGMQFILNALNSVLLALQLPATSSLIGTLGQLFSLVAVWVAVKFFYVNSLLFLGAIISVVPVLTLSISTVVVFWGKYHYLRPSLRYYNGHEVKGIINLGVKFFVVQIMTLVLYQTNNIIIANTVNNEAVVEYNVAYKYMGILYTLYMVVATPLWSATTDAYTKGELNWIIRANRRMIHLSFLFFILGVIMLLVSFPIYSFWLHNDKVTISFLTTLLCLLYVTAKMIYGCYGYIINGIGKLKAQIVFTGIMSVAYIPVAWVAGKFWGIYGIISVSILVNFMNIAWSKYQYYRLMTNTATGIWNL